MACKFVALKLKAEVVRKQIATAPNAQIVPRQVEFIPERVLGRESANAQVAGMDPVIGSGIAVLRIN